MQVSPAIQVAHLTKTFHSRGRREHKALDDVTLTIKAGEMVALIGASGSGKSTLLRHLAGLVAGDAASPSRIETGGVCIQEAGRVMRSIRRRRRQVGFVFQQFNLVGRLPVMTNVLVGALGRVPMWRSLLRRFTTNEKGKAVEALRRVGIADLALQRASTLSGGQQQRAAIARALVQEAKIILADEPIASLDPESARRVMELLATINREDGITVVVSLHQVEFARRYCPRAIALKEGAVVFDGASASLTPQLLRDLYGAESDLLFEVAEPQGGRPAARAAGPLPMPASFLVRAEAGA